MKISSNVSLALNLIKNGVKCLIAKISSKKVCVNNVGFSDGEVTSKKISGSNVYVSTR